MDRGDEPAVGELLQSGARRIPLSCDRSRWIAARWFVGGWIFFGRTALLLSDSLVLWGSGGVDRLDRLRRASIPGAPDSHPLQPPLGGENSDFSRNARHR